MGTLLFVGLSAAGALCAIAAIVLWLRRTRRRRGWAVASGILAVLFLSAALSSIVAQASRSTFAPAVTNRAAPVPMALSLIQAVADNSHVGIRALRARDGVVRWQVPPSSAPGRFTVAGGIIYAPSWGPMGPEVVALQASDGQTLWRTPIHIPSTKPGINPGGITSAPVVADGDVYIGVDNEANVFHGVVVVALRARDGQELWQRALDDYYTLATGQPLAAGGGLVYAGSLHGSMRAFRADDGSSAWQTSLPIHASVPMFPIFDAGAVYLRSPSANLGSIVALRAADGKLLWSYADPAGPLSATVLSVDDGTVYAVAAIEVAPTSALAGRSLTYALDAASGSLRWRFQIPSPGWAAPAGMTGITAAAGVVYLGVTGGIYALSVQDGNMLWHQNTGPGIAYLYPQVADGVIFVASTDIGSHTGIGSCIRFPGCGEGDHLNALSARDGAFYWRQPLPEGEGSAPLTTA